MREQSAERGWGVGGGASPVSAPAKTGELFARRTRLCDAAPARVGMCAGALGARGAKKKRPGLGSEALQNFGGAQCKTSCTTVGFKLVNFASAAGYCNWTKVLHYSHQ